MADVSMYNSLEGIKAVLRENANSILTLYNARKRAKEEGQVELKDFVVQIGCTKHCETYIFQQGDLFMGYSPFMRGNSELNVFRKAEFEALLKENFGFPIMYLCPKRVSFEKK